MNTLAYPIDEGLISGDGLTQLLAKYIAQSGVVEPNALKVAPLSSPDMKLEISGSTNDDHLVILKPSGGYLVGWNLEPAEVDIDPNITGVTKTDAIVAYFDLTAGDEGTPEAPGGLKFMVVRRPDAETGAVEDAQILSEVGHAFWHRLANQPVPHNATTISEGTVDTRQYAGINGALLQALSVDTGQLKNGSITNDKLADGSITRSKMGSGALPAVYINFGVVNIAPGSSYSLLLHSLTTVDFSKLLSGATAAYFSVAGNSNSGQTSYWILHNVTNGADILGTEVTTTSGASTEIRSGNILANLPTTSKQMGLRVKTGGGVTMATYRACLEIHY